MLRTDKEVVVALNFSFSVRGLVDYLLAGLLMLPEQVIEDGAVLLVDSLHLVDVLGHLLHGDEGVHEVLGGRELCD